MAPAALAQFASGQTWYGHSHYAGSAPAPSGGVSNQIVVVAGEPDYRAASGFGGWSVDLVGDRVVFEFSRAWHFNEAGGGTPTSFNGFWLSDFSHLHTDFAGFVVDPSSTLAPTQVE